ncbi:MAG TPA: hypothetical protein VEX36_09380 [Thermoleophilaceae bacterium]|nr:hypothetical protein [Thermoleophilaceae bacterium]
MSDRREGVDERREEEPVDLRPYLCIPYWTAPLPTGEDPDVGDERPLPGNVISWLCPGIEASPYTPGAQLDVRVRVRNSGAGSATALATVRVYWADATTGFSKPKLLGMESVEVQPRGGYAVTETISGEIPATASNHVCLLCVVSHSLDKAGKVADPVGDRHWAQRNLTAVAAAPGTPAIVPFLAANPLDEKASFQLSVEMLELDLLEQLARRVGAVPADVGLKLQLLDERGAVLGEDPRAVIDLDLEAGGRRLFNVAVEPLEELGHDELAAVEAVLFANQIERPVGSLGIIVRSPDAPPLRER